MNRIEITKLALRNLSRSKRRNVILGIAIAFGFFVVTAIDGLASGAVSNLEDQITQMIGGTVAITGYEKGLPEDKSVEINATEDSEDSEDEKDDSPINIIRDHNYLQDVVDKLGINYKYTSHYTRTTCQILFNGKKVLTQTYGRDFENDKSFIEALQLKDGSVENLKNKDALIINEGMANTLKVEVGDSVLLITTTIYGQSEVGDFTIAAISKDSNFVTGMLSYANIDTLNELINIPEGGYNFFSIYLKNKNEQNAVALQIEDAIKNDGVPVSDLREARKNYPKNPERGITKQFLGKENKWEGVKYAVESLDDSVPQLKSAMSIVHLVTTIILLVILLIVMVGISNTYRMVLYERIREIGTMRALGMTGKDSGRMFTTEAIILCILGGIVGLVLAIILMMILGLFHIENEAVQMFLKAGYISFVLSPISIIVQYILMIMLTALAVHGTAKKAARMSPAEALRTVK